MPAAEASLRALVLRVTLLLPKANQALARRALGQHERAVSFMTALATKAAKRQHGTQGTPEAAITGPHVRAEMATLLRATGTCADPTGAR